VWLAAWGDTVTRLEVVNQLQLLLHERLFAQDPWRCDRETLDALRRRLEQMGLEERVPDQADTWRATPLGVELHLDLMMVFMGLWENYEMPIFLAKYDLMDEITAESLQNQLFDPRFDSDPVLLPLVRECYRKYVCRSGLLN
jgi:hypothetical protein